MIYTIGEVIKRERKKQKISQEELSYGICTASWLSKIESGACIPTVAMFELLMKKLGKSTSQYVYYKSDLELEIEKLKFDIRRNYSLRNIEEAKNSFEKLKKQVREDNKLDQQFILLYDTILYQAAEDNQLETFKKVIEYTIPDFDVSKLERYLLTQEEIVSLNNMAIILKKMNQDQEAIALLEQLRRYLEDSKFDNDERLRTYPVVLCNLSKWQLLKGDMTNCISTCDKGIAFCVQNNVLVVLPDLLFNKGYALVALGNAQGAKKYITQAYALFGVMDKQAEAQMVKKYAQEQLGGLTIE